MSLSRTLKQTVTVILSLLAVSYLCAQTSLDVAGWS